MEDVVKLLLVIFNFYKPQISRDKTFKVSIHFDPINTTYVLGCYSGELPLDEASERRNFFKILSQ